MTALSSEDQRKRSEQLGVDKYLVKSRWGIEDGGEQFTKPGRSFRVGTNPVPVSQPPYIRVSRSDAFNQPVGACQFTRPDISSLSPQPATPPQHLTPANKSARTTTSTNSYRSSATQLITSTNANSRRNRFDTSASNNNRAAYGATFSSPAPRPSGACDQSNLASTDSQNSVGYLLKLMAKN